MKSAKASGFKEVKSGGRVSQTVVNGNTGGRPAAKVGGGSRGEFATQSAGTVSTGLPSRAEYAQSSAGK